MFERFGNSDFNVSVLKGKSLDQLKKMFPFHPLEDLREFCAKYPPTPPKTKKK